METLRRYQFLKCECYFERVRVPTEPMQRPEWASGPQEAELQVIISLSIGAGNGAWIL